MGRAQHLTYLIQEAARKREHLFKFLCPFSFLSKQNKINFLIFRLMMAKSNKQQQKSNSRKHGVSLRRFSSQCTRFCEDAHHGKRCLKASEKKEWEDAVCSVCMEFPHNAVLLLCSSYDKGCRPYMCATSHRYSNCLEQYRKAYSRAAPTQSTQPWQLSTDDPDLSGTSGWPDRKVETSELLCPLCRGQVKGWTVVEPARKFLNAKKRSCMQNNCSFVGTYKKLRKHVKLEHPLGCPREMDPSNMEKWKKLENERDLSDVFSAIRSTMPGAIVVGDYVIENNHRGFSRGYDVDHYLDDAIFRMRQVHSYGGRWNSSHDFFQDDYNSLDEGDFAMRQTGAVVSSRRIGNNVSRSVQHRARLLAGRRRRRLSESR
ncbi:Hypothetical predicted protein [Olea europaea subsp. europaea]|uniref:Uncharacterized protein n=1 Tax=Olea europaea subsp. europaea TaxID=158383 RepID=A0A8S0UPG8_OLEEU|nr:Hypothetical predicted protein [Olea europaea subsp. europaea]